MRMLQYGEKDRAFGRVVNSLGTPPFNKMQFGFAWGKRNFYARFIHQPEGPFNQPPGPNDPALHLLMGTAYALMIESDTVIDGLLHRLDRTLFETLTGVSWTRLSEDQLLAAGFPPDEECERWAAMHWE